MNRLRNSVGVFFSAALLAACGGASNDVAPSTILAPSPQSERALAPYAAVHVRKNTVTEAVLYSFTGATNGTDGVSPLYGSLIYHGGELFGTTSAGGHAGRGTAFKITPAGAYAQIYAFAYDGWTPEAGLTSRSNTGRDLFTTTNSNGANDYGTVVKISSAGKGKLLYSFAGGNDGANPIGGLTDVGGTLYGTTSAGGANGLGTVFKITTSGTENVLYTFGGGSDGANPYATLTNVNGTLYGTTFAGGANNTGTIFKITTAGAYTQLYGFAGGTDGANPVAQLTNDNGTLYGTTTGGGAHHSRGTVFTMTTSGAYNQLYSFGSGNGSRGADDGSGPYGELVKAHGAFYGTTSGGGSNGNTGTIFKITASGHYRQLYSFGSLPDGANPLAGLTYVNGTLYGTTSNGGSGCGGSGGCGTIYSLTGF